MGTWGVGAFENDGAADWVWEVEAAPSVATLMKAIDAVQDVVRAGDYLESSFCEPANAAAEFLAALRNRDPSALPPSAGDVYLRLSGRPTEDELNRARAVVERIAKDSELAELFAESGSEDDWRAAMQGLRSRLG